MLLRVAIGWHFLYEGLTKIDSYRDGEDPFTAKWYIANSSGPLRQVFLGVLEDPDGLQRLDPSTAATRWGGIVAELDRRFTLTEPQRQAAEEKIAELQAEADGHFGFLLRADLKFSSELNQQQVPEELRQTFEKEKLPVSSDAEVQVQTQSERWIVTDHGAERAYLLRAYPDALMVYDYRPGGVQRKISEYVAALGEVEVEQGSRIGFEREQARNQTAQLRATRKELLDPIDAWDKELREKIVAGLTPDQTGSSGPSWFGLPFPLSWPEKKIDQVNLVTMLGLTVCGGLMILGLFSRLGSLGAAVLVGSFFLCNPAPPLGAQPPGDPGHYMYVNKELIECLAALALATIPTGRWLGLDALIHGLITRPLGTLFGSRDSDD